VEDRWRGFGSCSANLHSCLQYSSFIEGYSPFSTSCWDPISPHVRVGGILCTCTPVSDGGSLPLSLFSAARSFCNNLVSTNPSLGVDTRRRWTRSTISVCCTRTKARWRRQRRCTCGRYNGMRRRGERSTRRRWRRLTISACCTRTKARWRRRRRCTCGRYKGTRRRGKRSTCQRCATSRLRSHRPQVEDADWRPDLPYGAYCCWLCLVEIYLRAEVRVWMSCNCQARTKCWIVTKPL
jgi:hypothetical protein